MEFLAIILFTKIEDNNSIKILKKFDFRNVRISIFNQNFGQNFDEHLDF